MRVQDLLDRKGRDVHTITVDSMVEEAIDRMTQRNISALIVVDGQKPVGIFTERDVLRCHVQHREEPFSAIPIKKVMTNKLIVAEPDDEISDTMSMMIQTDIRHLPVIGQGGKLAGMLSIRDLVQQQVGSLTAELHYLQDYIADLQEAGQD